MVRTVSLAKYLLLQYAFIVIDGAPNSLHF